ncbi:MAG TPA: mannosyltransferase family protein, partial [Pseudonocardiaceae bacterium]
MSTTEVGQLPDSVTGDFGQAPTGTEFGRPSSIMARAAYLSARWATAARVISALLPAALYLAVREVGLLALDWAAGRNHVDTMNALTSWDGEWFLAVARYGYANVPMGLTDAFGQRDAFTPLAFFPGYPTALRWVADLPGVSLTSAALVLSAASGVACAYALMRMADALPWITRPREVGFILVVLFAASPMAIVLSMAYSEALFCALVAWSLVGLMERRWVLAGSAAALAGLVRPTAGALVLTVVIAAVIAIVRRQDSWRPWVGGTLAPAGLIAYLSFVADRTGDLGGWFAVQAKGWNSQFDGGIATVRFGLAVLATGRSVLEVTTIAVLVTAIALVLVAIRLRIGWPLIVYGALVLAMDVGSNGLMNSKARL